MVQVHSVDSVALIGRLLHDSGYDFAHLGHQLDLDDGLHADLENLGPLLAKTEGDSVLAVLARLFFVCWPVEEKLCRAVLPEPFLKAAFECRLLEKENGDIASSACLFPFRSWIIACDSCRTRTSKADMVAGPSSSTQYPACLAVGGDQETTLDLGTGTGALAFEAARYSRKVVGTDINPRTLRYAEFNAALNGVTSIEWRCGDAFGPVAGERFSRIVANPPFFLSPSFLNPARASTYSDSPLELDGFTARLARECSTYLEEGGFYQMICEWVEIEGESWEKRLREWTSASACDVLVLPAPSATPLNYAEKRTKESRMMRSGGLEYSFEERYQYLRFRSVKKVMSGVINMRKRTGGANWFTVVSTDPVGSEIGGDVRARFEALTFLSTSKAEEILETRLKLAPNVVLDKRACATGQQWVSSIVELVKLSGLVDRLRLDDTVSRFVPLFDGTKTVGEIASIVAQQLGIGMEDAQRRSMTLARRLLQSNFVNL